MISNGLPSTPSPRAAASQEKKVIDVVDLDDDDDVTPQASTNTVSIPSSQFRLVPTNQLQQQSLPQGLTYTVVSTGSTMSPGLNRVLVARPQMNSGQIIVSRNGITNGPGPGRPLQVCK